jgi:hypothetical protein
MLLSNNAHQIGGSFALASLAWFHLKAIERKHVLVVQVRLDELVKLVIGVLLVMLQTSPKEDH